MPCAPRLRSRLLVIGLIAGILGSLALPAAAIPITREFPARIDAYAGYEGQTQCSGAEQPGVVAFRSLLVEDYGANGAGILRACSQGAKSEHKEGRAYDWMLDAGDAEDRVKAAEVLDWLLATDEHGNRHAVARRLGIMYIIWNRQTWSAYRPDAGWQPYHGANPHTDHIHFSFSRAGAEGKTSFWTSPEVVTAAPGPFPDVTQAHPFVAAIDWAMDTGIASGRPDGRFLPGWPVTRGQMATMLWREAGEPSVDEVEGFGDVAEDAYYHDAVSWLHEAGVTDGVGAGRFAPAAPISRGQLASLLYRLEGSPDADVRHGFDDVSDAHHYDDAVAWLSSNDVIRGVTATRFGGNDPVTRAQAAALLYRRRDG